MISFVFPGQGAQFAGMGKELADNFSVAKDAFVEANDSLGYDIAGMCFEGPEEDLKLTANTQPAILTTSIAALRVLQQETDLVPSFVAGHSLGEYSALVAAGALSLADAVKTVHLRGTFMQEAVPVGTGTMAAIMGVDRPALEELCAQACQGEVVAPANFNSPGQIVIAGHTGAVERAIDLAKDAGAKRALLLPVSAPFHSELMAPAARRLEDVLAGIDVQSLAVPVISNVEASAYQDVQKVKPLLIEQVCAAVRWDESVVAMKELGVTSYVEVGPGKVLSGLIKRIDRGATLQNVCDLASLAKLAK